MFQVQFEVSLCYAEKRGCLQALWKQRDEKMRLEVGDYAIIAVLFVVALTIFTPFGYDFIKSSKGGDMILMENTVDLINRYNSLLSQNKLQKEKIE